MASPRPGAGSSTGLPLDPIALRLVELAIEEDLAAGDPTSEATVDPELQGTGLLKARKCCVIAGLAVTGEVFRQVDRGLRFEALHRDGERLVTGEVAARVSGCVLSILRAERTALNFLRHLSGVATLTAAYVQAAAGGRVRVVDTRKTTPGMRSLEKAAVRCGGGQNHRFNLGDGLLIKDNHIVAARGIRAAVARARSRAHHLLKVEVEVRSLDELEQAIEAGAEVVLLDNMDPEGVRAAVEAARGRVLLEASGGIDLQSIATYADSGVDLISVGALTHSARDADLSLDLQLRDRS